VSLAELGDFLESSGELCQLAGPPQSLYGPQLVVRCSARPDQVCMVGIRQAIGPRARGRHDGALLEEQDGSACARECECVRDRFDALRVRDGVPVAIEHTEAYSFLVREACDELGA
jgi:hypothetical protein